MMSDTSEPPKKKRRSKWDVAAPSSSTLPAPPLLAPPPSSATPPPPSSSTTVRPPAPSEAAAAAAAKLNAMLAAQGKLIKPAQPPLLPPPSTSHLLSNTLVAPPTATPTLMGGAAADGGAMFAEIVINDLDQRAHLTKAATLTEIHLSTGAFVSVRGRFMTAQEKASNTSDRPLYLHIQGPKQDTVNAAVGKVNEIIRSSQPAGVGLLLTPPVMPLAALFPTSTAHPPGGGRKGEQHYVQDKVFVGLEQVPETFNLLEKLQGPGGAFLSHISTQTGAKAFLRGRGSGYMEPTSGRESFEALYIYISHSKPEGLSAARKLCESLIETVRGEFAEWKRSQQPLGFGSAAIYGPPPPRHPGYPGYGGPYHSPYGPLPPHPPPPHPPPPHHGQGPPPGAPPPPHMAPPPPMPGYYHPYGGYEGGEGGGAFGPPPPFFNHAYQHPPPPHMEHPPSEGGYHDYPPPHPPPHQSQPFYHQMYNGPPGPHLPPSADTPPKRRFTEQSGDHSGGTNEQPVRLRGESPPSGHMTDRDQGRRMFTEKGGGGGGGDDEASTANSLSQTDLPLATRGEVTSTEFSKPNEEGKAMPPPPHPPQRTRPQPHPSEEAPSPPTSKAQLMPPPSLPGASLRSKGVPVHPAGATPTAPPPEATPTAPASLPPAPSPVEKPVRLAHGPRLSSLVAYADDSDSDSDV